jgi:hypothetical protein
MPDSGLADALTQWATAIKEDAAQNLYDRIEPPADSGRLADSGKVDQSGPLSATISFDAESATGEPYASFTDQGTPAHEIVGSPLLSFYWPRLGKVVVLRRVQHPGTVGTGWFSNVVTDDAWAGELEQAAASRDL